MKQDLNLLELLDYIDPAQLDYQEWVNVGMGLKESGHTASDWDNWSQRDRSRYHAGECYKKWGSFSGSANPVTGGTIVQMAKDHGWKPGRPDYAFDWDDEISVDDDYVVIDKNWIEEKEVREPEAWEPVNELITYLKILFESNENVGYVTETWQNDEGKYLPKKGSYDRTAGQLIQELSECGGDIGKVIGDYKKEAGAWIRFNPLDGKDVKNENVTDHRYALVESDHADIDKQYAIIQELELPVACLVHSGKKSLHAIVKVEAANYEEYRKRVDYLYNICKKNGLAVDSQNRNPSRLSRMPGITRNGRKQFLLGTTLGKSCWAEWQEWIESVNDDLPEPESIKDIWDDLPDLSPTLIDGVLRQGHKMLMAGPSKAGKSFALIELCCAIAEGRHWVGWKCTQGKVLYVNLELDRASCLHRFRDVYTALTWQANNLANIDIWNLRGKSMPMDKLAPKLIRRAAKKNYIAVIIDPIYKVITGDENSADQMANFCNQFDKVCTELGVAVIYCHHHSKGSQGSKRSMDRASGSGVFARDPDALIDLIELEISDKLREQQANTKTCEICAKWLDMAGLKGEASQDDLCSSARMKEICQQHLSPQKYKEITEDIQNSIKAMENVSAWRIEGTLREFPKFPPKNLWFDYPIHRIDNVGVLSDIKPEGDMPPWQKATNKRKNQAKDEREAKNKALEDAINNCKMGEPPTKSDVAEYLGISERTVANRIRWYGKYTIDKNSDTIIKKDSIKD